METQLPNSASQTGYPTVPMPLAPGQLNVVNQPEYTQLQLLFNYLVLEGKALAYRDLCLSGGVQQRGNGELLELMITRTGRSIKMDCRTPRK